LPAANTLDDAGLKRMLTTYGVTRPTPVPDVDPWAATDLSKEGEQ
jgi:hypothetical protein